MKSAKLTAREAEVIELIATGNSQKEIAGVLHISALTVDAHLKSIKTKTHLQKVTELTAAWFCRRYNLPSFTLPENIRRRISVALLALSVFTAVMHTTEFIRVNPVSTTGRAITRTIRTRTTEYDYLPLTA